MENEYSERESGRNRKFLKMHGYTKARLIEEGYKALTELKKS